MSATQPGVLHPLDPDSLRQAFSMFPSGVTAVCAQRGGAPVGMAASTFTPVSLDPPLVSVCVARASTTWPVLRSATRLGVSVLGVGHRDVVRQLAARQGDRFRGLSYHADGDAILLEGAALWAVCALEQEVPAGDHDIAVLRVHAVDPHPEVRPVVFHASGFHEIGTCSRCLSPLGPGLAHLSGAGPAELGGDVVGGSLELLFDFDEH